MRITFAVVFIIAFTFIGIGQPLTHNTAKANSKRAELPEGTEAAKAIARLGDLSRPALCERLQQLRQPDTCPVRCWSIRLWSGRICPSPTTNGLTNSKPLCNLCWLTTSVARCRFMSYGQSSRKRTWLIVPSSSLRHA